MSKIVVFSLVLFALIGCNDRNQEVIEKKPLPEMDNGAQAIVEILIKTFPKHDIKTIITNNNLYINYYDSMGNWGLDSYEHILVEQMVSYLDTLLNPIVSAEFNFSVFNNKELTQKYVLSKDDINKIIRNHKNNPKLLAYKHYLTNTMTSKECHDLLSALYGIAQGYKDDTLKTDFYRFSLMYAEANLKGKTEKEKYYRSVMNELYDGFSDPKTIANHHVNPQHIKNLMKILE
ncbi:MAG: hypothetical protein ACYDCN_14795 [Bacteroidia bacterium]